MTVHTPSIALPLSLAGFLFAAGALLLALS